MLSRRRFSTIFTLCAMFLLLPAASHARDVLVYNAQENGVKYEVSGVDKTNLPQIATLRELFARVVESGDTVYVVENWDSGGSGGNEEVTASWDLYPWDARFIVTEPIEISRDVEIYASCKGRKNSDGSIEFVNRTKEGDMKDDLTTFEGKGKSQIFVITGGAKVTIANLRIHGGYNANSGGGAVAVTEGSDATIKNCWIVKNIGAHIDGTGVYVNKSRLNIQNSDISRNKSEAGKGCAIALDEGSYAYIFNCTITSNDTYWRAFGGAWVDYYGDGGGIAVMGISSADIVSCDISRNTGNYGGGVHVKTKKADGKSAGDGISSVTIKDCKISDNFCGYNHRGGGIDIESAAAEITNCTISGNVVSGEDWANTFGGGIHIYYPKDHVIIKDCVITDNFAADGGGVYATGASYTGDCSPVIKNCLISDNTATTNGGGIYAGAVLVVDSCTIIGNSNPGIENDGYGSEVGGGGGIWVSDRLLMTNSTVTKNSTYYGHGGGGIYYTSAVSGSDECMLSNCTIVDNSARNGGTEIQRDGASRLYRIPIINALIYNTTSPDRTVIHDTDDYYDRSRMMFFNCAIPESLTLPARSPSFDIVKIASWNNPVSSTKTVNGVTHTVYKIENNPALKPIVGAGANRVIYSNEYYTPDVNYTSPSFDQLGTTRVNSPDIGAMEKAVTVPVLSKDADIHVVENTAITPHKITDTEVNKALNWKVSGNIPSGVTASEDANGMNFTLSGSPSKWGDYDFRVIASNEKGSDDVRVKITVYTAPVVSDEVEIKAVKDTAMTQKFPAVSGNHLVWTLSGDVSAGLEVSSDDASFMVSGTPTETGDYSFTMRASNFAGSDDMKVNITVYEKPVLSGDLTIEAVKDSAITAKTITALSGNLLTWSVTGTVPSGILTGFSESTATISGTPTAAGDYSFKVAASNYAGSDDAKVDVTVYAKPELSAGEITLQAVEGRAVNETVSVNSGNHLKWTKTGTFPNGLRISSSDESLVISGTPANASAGSYDCTFTASNLAGTATLRVKTTVYSVPTLSETSAVIDAKENTAIAAKTITAASGNYLKWSTGGNLPSGVSVSSNDRSVTLSGTPSKGTRGSYVYTVTAENYAGTAESRITLNVITDDFEMTSKDVSTPTKLSDFLATLSQTQSNAIRRLKLNGYITDLSGIGSLINLQALDLTEATALTSVSLASNDTILSLDIHGNASITELDIRASSLVYVNAESCANLALVNAENCTNLETLLCKSCAVNELYLSGCADLMTLDFTGNKIRKFNTRGFNVLADFKGTGQILSVDVLAKSFDFGSFLSSAKVSVIEPSVTSTDIENVKNVKGYDNEGDEISCSYDTATGIASFDTVPYKVEYSYMAASDMSIDVTVWGEPDLSAPVLSSRDVRISATEGTAITPVTITATPTDYMTWSTSGTLPNGLTGVSSGNTFTLSGTPSTETSGDYTYTVTASNPAGSTSAVVTVNVRATEPLVPPSAPVLSGQSFRINAKEGEAITALNIAAVSGDNISWSSIGTLPNGLTGTSATDGKSYTISGTPLAGTSGIYNYNVIARNNAGATSADVEIVVSFVLNPQSNQSLSDVIDSLTPEQIASIKSIAVGENVTDLSGLDRLTNLEALDLTEAKSLESVNLSGNTSVKDVDVSGNGSVKSLNLANSNVEKVNAEGCDSLEEVNVEGNTTIKELNVTGTNVSSLNASGCENLEDLECSSCKIDSLNLEGCVNLKNLNFGGNAVRRFNARGFNRLENMSCSGQEVTGQTMGRTFDMSGFMDAAQVSGVYASDTDGNVKNVRGYDASGSEIAAQYNATTGEVTFAKAPSRITYDYDTGFNGTLMDVAITGTSVDDDAQGVSSSSSGCDTGLAGLAALMLLGFVFSRKE